MNFSPVNNDLPGVSIHNPLALPSFFVLVLFLRALDKSSIIKFNLISYVSFSILLMFKPLTFLKGFYLLVFSLSRVPDLYFLKMPVNLAQYRVTAGIFNNRKISRNLKFEVFQFGNGRTICLNMFQSVLHYYFIFGFASCCYLGKVF